jgi:hypothetical protein
VHLEDEEVEAAHEEVRVDFVVEVVRLGEDVELLEVLPEGLPEEEVVPVVVVVVGSAEEVSLVGVGEEVKDLHRIERNKMGFLDEYRWRH